MFIIQIYKKVFNYGLYLLEKKFKMKKRINPKIDAMRERSLIVENDRQNLHTPKYYLNEQSEEHKVVQGDTGYAISKKYGVTLDELKELNPDIDIKKLQVGQELVVSKEEEGFFSKLFNSKPQIEWLGGVSKQVQNQVKYLIKNDFEDDFTIVDDKNAKVYAINDDYSLHKVYNVITGKKRGDKLAEKNAVDFVKDNWVTIWEKYSDGDFDKAVNYVSNCYLKSIEEIKNTPSGIFKRSGIIWGAIQDILLTGFMENVYGKKYIGWETQEGKTIPFGFHGTETKARLDSLGKKSAACRKMSYGCINFLEEDIKNVNDFIFSGDYSNEILKF